MRTLYLAFCLRQRGLRLLHDDLRKQRINPGVLACLDAAADVLHQHIGVLQLALVQITINPCGCNIGSRQPQLARQLEPGRVELPVKACPLRRHIGLRSGAHTGVPQREFNLSLVFAKALVSVQAVGAVGNADGWRARNPA